MVIYPKYDCIYHFANDLESNGIRFGAKVVFGKYNVISVNLIIIIKLVNGVDIEVKIPF